MLCFKRIQILSYYLFHHKYGNGHVALVAEGDMDGFCVMALKMVFGFAAELDVGAAAGLMLQRDLCERELSYAQAKGL